MVTIVTLPTCNHCRAAGRGHYSRPVIIVVRQAMVVIVTIPTCNHCSAAGNGRYSHYTDL